MGVPDVSYLSGKYQPVRIEFVPAWMEDLAHLTASPRSAEQACREAQEEKK